jgi:hypothetical protein
MNYTKSINIFRKELLNSLKSNNTEVSLIISIHLIEMNEATITRHLISRLISNYCEYVCILYPENLSDIYGIWCNLLSKMDYNELQKLIQLQIQDKTSHLQKIISVYSNIEIKPPNLESTVWESYQITDDSDNLRQNMLCFIAYYNQDSYNCLKYVFNIINLSKNREKSAKRFNNWKPSKISNKQKLLGKCQKGEYAIWEYLLLNSPTKLLNYIEILFLFYYKLNDKKIYLICAVVLILLSKKKRLMQNKYKNIKPIEISNYLKIDSRHQYLNKHLPQQSKFIDFPDNLTEQIDLDRYYKIIKKTKKKIITLNNENELIMDPIPINKN